MINLDEIKRRIDILELTGHDVELELAAKTDGGEYSGPCPFCKAGIDRFSVWPRTGRFWCRVCDKKGDVLDYIMLRDNVTLPEAARRLGGVDSVVERIPPQPHKAPVKPLYTQPPPNWQQAAKNAIDHCEKTLHGPEGKPGLDYLHSRGLNDETIRYFRLGYAPQKLTGKTFTVWPGILIPCIVAGRVWYIKIRSLATDPQHRYLSVKGSKTNALFNASDVNAAAPCVICEGEFNTMIAWQELQDVAAFVSPGAAKNRLDLATWGAYLAEPERLIACFDNDAAGQSGAAWLADELGAYLAPVPQGDLNEFYLSGGNLWVDWLGPVLNECDPLPEEHRESEKPIQINP